MNRQQKSSMDSADVHFRLAKAWHLQGNLEQALAGYQRVLALDPGYMMAYLKLGDLKLYQGDTNGALEYYLKSLALNPADRSLQFRCRYLKEFSDKSGSSQTPSIKTPVNNKAFSVESNPDGKINLYDQKTFTCHRSGWTFAMHALRPLHNSRGILFDGFIENNFAWKHWKEGKSPPDVLEKMNREGTFDFLATSEEKGITPYTRPWVGFIHNPHGMPAWFHYQEAPQTIFAKDIWKRSLPHCVGLFTFSEYHARWLREQTGKPVSTLVHPTEIPPVRFDFYKFINNPRKKIVQIGWWLRKLTAIYQLPVKKNNPLGYEKIRLVPFFFDNAEEYLRGLMDKEKERENLTIPSVFSENTKEITHLPNDEYDELLSENIVFADLYDSNANNVIIECVARTTPLLINPHPAVVEYLGKNYPMYFNTLSEAADKSLDASLIMETHTYLKKCDVRNKLGGNYFLKSFMESDVYRLI